MGIKDFARETIKQAAIIGTPLKAVAPYLTKAVPWMGSAGKTSKLVGRVGRYKAIKPTV